MRPWRAISPGVLLGALATHTSHIGLVLTAPVLFGGPATGASESSKQFGSKWADALFTSHWEKPSAQGSTGT